MTKKKNVLQKNLFNFFRNKNDTEDNNDSNVVEQPKKKTRKNSGKENNSASNVVEQPEKKRKSAADSVVIDLCAESPPVTKKRLAPADDSSDDEVEVVETRPEKKRSAQESRGDGFTTTASTSTRNSGNESSDDEVKVVEPSVSKYPSDKADPPKKQPANLQAQSDNKANTVVVGEAGSSAKAEGSFLYITVFA